MKPPKCRLCEHEHWTNEPHRFDRIDAIGTKGGKASVTTVTSPGAKPRYAQVVQVACNQCVTKDAEIARLKQELQRLAQSTIASLPKKAKRDRAAYMRDYRAGK